MTPDHVPATSIPGAVEPSSMGTAALTDMRELFQLAFERNASDIHLTEDTPPILRVNGSLQPMTFAPLSRADTKRLVFSLLTDRQKAQFERGLELDISIDVQGPRSEG